MNVDSRRVGAELIGQSEGVGSSVVFLHRRDHEGGEVGTVLHVEPPVPAVERATRADPLHRGYGVSGEHSHYREGLPWLGADVLWKSFDFWWGTC